jgi:hypothetical protein
MSVGSSSLGSPWRKQREVPQHSGLVTDLVEEVAGPGEVEGLANTQPTGRVVQ